MTKKEIQTAIQDNLESNDLKISGTDFQRPWGGFFKISDGCLDKFISVYFPGVKLTFDKSLNLSPKILVVEPSKKLSWQVHERRSELWRVVKGPVGIYRSSTDEQPAEMEIFKDGETIELKLGTRHRLVGLDDWGIVAEIWVHQYPGNPSDEDDIRRIEDDYGR